MKTRDSREKQKAPSAVRCSDLLASIEREMANAYGVGHCHGMNPMRTLNHQKPQRVNEGWGKYAKRLFKEIKPMLANSVLTNKKDGIL